MPVLTFPDGRAGHLQPAVFEIADLGLPYRCRFLLRKQIEPEQVGTLPLFLPQRLAKFVDAGFGIQIDIIALAPAADAAGFRSQLLSPAFEIEAEKWDARHYNALAHNKEETRRIRSVDLFAIVIRTRKDLYDARAQDIFVLASSFAVEDLASQPLAH